MATALMPDAPQAVDDDVPRVIVAKASGGDRIFRGILRAAGFLVLVITSLILIFLAIRSLSAFHRAGISFFTTQSFYPETSDHFGIAALLPDAGESAAAPEHGFDPAPLVPLRLEHP